MLDTSKHLKSKSNNMIKHFYTFIFMLFISGQTFSQDYTFEDFIGTWHGYISSESFGGYYDPMTMVIEPDGFYTETSGHLMPTIYPNTQESEFEAETTRYHWWYLKTVYAGQYFYQHFFYEVVYFQNDTLEMHYNFWDDPEPHPQAGTIFLVRETSVGIEDDPVSSYNPERKLINVYDLMGREVDPETNDAILIYQYDDGSFEKRYNNSPYRNR
jgi:hypothetical protein